MPSDELTRQLLAEASRLDYTLDAPTTARLRRYFDLLAHWSTAIRVTGSRDPVQLVQRHFSDSVALAKVLPAGKPLRCVDVGSGGGLPGLPVAVLQPDLHITFVEAKARKCALLHTAIAELDCHAEVLNERVETVIDPLTPFDAAWALAVFAPARWLALGAQLVRPGGPVAVFTAQNLQVDTTSVRVANTLEYTLSDGTPRVVTTYVVL